MAKNTCKTFPNGTKVTWHYRSAIGHGTVVGVAKVGKDCQHTKFRIKETDHHVSATGSREAAVVQHYGSALRKA